MKKEFSGIRVEITTDKCPIEIDIDTINLSEWNRQFIKRMKERLQGIKISVSYHDEQEVLIHVSDEAFYDRVLEAFDDININIR